MPFMPCGNGTRAGPLRRLNRAPASLSARRAPQNSGVPIAGILRGRAGREKADLRRNPPGKMAVSEAKQGETLCSSIRRKGRPELFAKMLGSVD
jgi:hypothetical protein